MAAVFSISVWGLSLPAMDNLKNAPGRTAEAARELSDGQGEVIIANRKGSPPSLIFYLERQGLKWREVYDLTSLKKKAREGERRGFILGADIAGVICKNNFFCGEKRDRKRA